MLLMVINEATKEGGLAEETIDTIWDFATDQSTISDPNLHDHVANLRDPWGMNR